MAEATIIQDLRNELDQVKIDYKQEIDKNEQLLKEVDEFHQKFTENEQIKIKLIEYKNRFRALVENSPNYIVLLDRKMVINDSNRIREDLEKTDVIGKKLTNFYKLEYQEPIKTAFKEAIEKEKTTKVEAESVTGARGFTQFTPIKKGDKIIEVLLIGINITELLKSEQNLKESEERYRLLIENSPNYIATVNREGLISFQNRSTYVANMDEVIGSVAYRFLKEDSIEIYKNALNQVYETKQNQIAEVLDGKA